VYAALSVVPVIVPLTLINWPALPAVEPEPICPEVAE
jgi:hypothetical protein